MKKCFLTKQAAITLSDKELARIMVSREANKLTHLADWNGDTWIKGGACRNTIYGIRRREASKMFIKYVSHYSCV